MYTIMVSSIDVRANSSAVEHLPYKEGVPGSRPGSPTNGEVTRVSRRYYCVPLRLLLCLPSHHTRERLDTLSKSQLGW